MSLKKLVAAARSNPKAKGQPVTYSGVRTYEAALVDEASSPSSSWTATSARPP
ncbi:hypothetical protein [Streptomyces sp. Z26]|uniref:hypothetical protein n=1 Tax=Streptomyces sp. Z26 TaxID=2500177 RepID=UPI0014051D2A|nr:hypothetical protein [Streptomyces sp. Z26]